MGRRAKAILDWFNKILGFAAAIVTIIVVFIDAKEYAVWIAVAVISWIGINAFYVFFQIFKAKHAAKLIKKKYFDRERKIDSGLHKYMHKLRDYTAAVDVEKTNSSELIKSCELLCASINGIFDDLCQDILESDESFSTCIKIVKTDSILDTDYNKWRLETFGRSPSTLADRKMADLDDILVIENTDFLVIVNGKTSYVSFKDMRNIEEDFLKKYKIEYKNSRKDFIDYYRSCIIIPIEIDWSNASDRLRTALSLSPKKKLLLGFLCIDTMKIFLTDEETKYFECAIEIAKAIGDSLYLFFEKVLMQQMNQRKNVDV